MNTNAVEACLTCMHAFNTQGGGGGVLGVSSDGDDRRTFLGLKFSISEFFGVRKFGKYFFG